MDFAYARGLLSVAEPGDLSRALWRRVGGRLSPPRAPPIDDEARRAAAAALARAPRLFAHPDFEPRFKILFPDAMLRIRARAHAILRREIELFGRPVRLPARIDWRRDLLSGRRLRGDALLQQGADAKAAWELARAGHLVELGAAARLLPELGAAARREIADTIGGFIDDNPAGQGIHYASPLEVALRAIHWLAAIELAGGAAAFSPAFNQRLGGALLADAHFLATHLENRGVVPANHLLGDWVGLWALGLALDGAPGARAWQVEAARGLAAEARRQVGTDGAHFEASTAYHRFALELMLVAHLYARAAGRPSPVGETLHAMFAYLRSYLGPDGCEPAFGDGDDARLLPIVPRAPRQHGYLASVGATLFADPALRAPGDRLSEEALWLVGPEAARVWSSLPSRPLAAAASFASGGVHVLRSRRWQVELRSGSYGQKGVGGHAHNDQLSLVAWLDGAPLLVDSGTGCYAADPAVRDRFRGTAAHSTLFVDGAEQSPILDGRPFALLDRAHAPPVALEVSGARVRVTGEHHGYDRLPARVRHRRRVTLDRAREIVVVEDLLSGEGSAAVELRWHLGSPAALGLSAGALAEVRALEPGLGSVDHVRALTLADGRALLVGQFPAPLRLALEEGLFSPGYGAIEAIALVTFRGRLTFPTMVRTIFVRRRGE